MGLFASKAVRAAGADRLFYGHPAQLGIQALAVLTSVVFACVGILNILKVVAKISGLRVSEEARIGLNLSPHDETACS